MVEVKKIDEYLKRGCSIVIDQNEGFYSGFLISRLGDDLDVDYQDVDVTFILASFPHIVEEIGIWGEYLNISYHKELGMFQSSIRKLSSSGLYCEKEEHGAVLDFEKIDKNFFSSLDGLEEKISRQRDHSHLIIKKER